MTWWPDLVAGDGYKRIDVDVGGRCRTTNDLEVGSGISFGSTTSFSSLSDDG